MNEKNIKMFFVFQNFNVTNFDEEKNFFLNIFAKKSYFNRTRKQ